MWRSPKKEIRLLGGGGKKGVAVVRMGTTHRDEVTLPKKRVREGAPGKTNTQKGRNLFQRKEEKGGMGSLPTPQNPKTSKKTKKNRQ